MRAALRRIRDHRLILGALVATLSSAKKLGIRIPAQIYQHVPYRGPIRVDLDAGRYFAMHSTGDITENSLFWEGISAHEPASLSHWMSHARRAACILDIGANTGIYSIAAAACSDAQIHAFEPIARIHRILENNILLNGYKHVSAWRTCVSDTEGHIEMFDPGGNAPSSASASKEYVRERLRDHPVTPVIVDTTTVDVFCRTAGIQKIDLIKIDVEGHEACVLRGMKETIKRSRPVILIEVLPSQSEELEEQLRQLEMAGYIAERVDEGPGHPSRNLLLRPAELV